MIRASHFEMTAVGVISRTRALGRDHGRSQRPPRRAGCAERGTIMRLLNALKNLPADADGWLPGVDFSDFENPRRIMIAEFVAQFIAALRNAADAAPLPVAHLKNLFQQTLRGLVSFPPNGARILIFHLGAPFFELPDDHQRAL